MIINFLPAQSQTLKFIERWLLLACLFILLMVLVGGLTRLTESGLSMTDWHPIHGVIPPMNEQQWLEEFAQYKQSPEYQLKNKGMSLESFKYIFLWEYGHRMLGRVLGLIFLLPLVYLVVSMKISGRMAALLFAIFSLGGLQGGIGWFMVQSGLVDNPDVSPYRLLLHLSMALILFCLCWWVCLSARFKRLQTDKPNIGSNLIKFNIICLVAVFITIGWGAMVAGFNAGLVYNTYPLMGGQLVPPEFGSMGHFFYDITHNPVSIQFVHRWLGTITFFVLLFFARKMYVIYPLYSKTIVVFAWLQVLLGIGTLVLQVPLLWAALHQLNVVFLLGALVASLRLIMLPKL